MKEKIAMWIAWHLPKAIVKWAGFRIGANATKGQWSTQIVPELNYMDAMQRWDNDT